MIELPDVPHLEDLAHLKPKSTPPTVNE